MRAVLLVPLLLLSSCMVLDKTMDRLNPDTGETEQVRVGDAIADTIDESVTPIASSVLSLLTGNPVLGGSAAALLAAAAGAGLRRRKKQIPTDNDDTPE